jgi:hypothetical protein
VYRIKNDDDDNNNNNNNNNNDNNNGKGKVVPVLNYPSTTPLGTVYIKIHVFLTSAQVVGKRSASRPCRFTPQGKSPRYPFDRRLGGPQSRYWTVTIIVNHIF